MLRQSNTPDMDPDLSSRDILHKKPRRPHTKTRTGCKICRRRKVKACIYTLICKFPDLIVKINSRYRSPGDAHATQRHVLYISESYIIGKY